MTLSPGKLNVRVETMEGIMLCSTGYASHMGCIVYKGDRVVLTPATNMPTDSDIDYFAECTARNNGSIGIGRNEVTILEG